MLQTGRAMVTAKNRATAAGSPFVADMLQRPTFLLACLVAPLAACATEGDDVDCSDGKCDVDQSCSDARYGDGTCQTDLTCAVPDIDCFRTFDSDEAAAAWFTELEPRAAQAEGRPARKILDATDPHFPKMRALLDRGWEAMRHQVPVGKLGDQRPGLVFLVDESVNAFVFPEDLDQKRASFAVMIHSATLELPTSDDATLGLVMHELQHAVGLHVIAGTSEKVEKFYLAADYEPIGVEEEDNSDVRAAVTQWRGGAAEVGPFSNEGLGGLPAAGGFFSRMFKTVIAAGVQSNPAGCAHTQDLIVAVGTEVGNSIDPISNAVTVDASFKSRITELLTAARDECLADFTASFVDVAAQIVGVTPDMIEAQLTPEDKALVTGKHVIDAIAAVSENRRAGMRAVEAGAESGLGAPWSLVRFYSTEENADENSVTVLRGAGLDPTGLATFFLEVLMPKPAADACNDLLATGAVPAYGADLLDTHHGNCWRVYHQHAFADHTARSRPRAPVVGPASPLRPKMPFAAPRQYAVY